MSVDLKLSLILGEPPMLAAERFMKPNASRTIPDSIYIKYLVLRNISAESPRVKSSIQIFMPTDI